MHMACISRAFSTPESGSVEAESVPVMPGICITDDSSAGAGYVCIT
jgi:hypothetical protein